MLAVKHIVFIVSDAPCHRFPSTCRCSRGYISVSWIDFHVPKVPEPPSNPPRHLACVLQMYDAAHGEKQVSRDHIPLPFYQECGLWSGLSGDHGPCLKRVACY